MSSSPPPYDSPLSIDDEESDLEGENLLQKFLLGNRKQRERVAVAVGERTAVAVKKEGKFLENLSKGFPKADKLFNDELKDDEEEINCDELSEITILLTQMLFKELSDGKIPEELKLFGRKQRYKLKFYAMKNVGMLNESNETFWTTFPQILLMKSYLKIK